MNKIRATYSDDGSTPIGNNFRPTNDLNSRIISRSYDTGNASSIISRSCDTGDASFLKQDAIFLSVLYFTMLLLC